MRNVPRRYFTYMNTFSNTTRGHTQTNIGKHRSIRFPAKHYWLSFTGDEMELEETSSLFKTTYQE